MLDQGSEDRQARIYARVGEALRKSMKSCALATDAETLEGIVIVDSVE